MWLAVRKVTCLHVIATMLRFQSCHCECKVICFLMLCSKQATASSSILATTKFVLGCTNPLPLIHTRALGAHAPAQSVNWPNCSFAKSELSNSRNDAWRWKYEVVLIVTFHKRRSTLSPIVSHVLPCSYIWRVAWNIVDSTPSPAHGHVLKLHK